MKRDRVLASTAQTKNTKPPRADSINDTRENRARRSVPVTPAEVITWFSHEHMPTSDHGAEYIARSLNDIAAGPISDAPPDDYHCRIAEIAHAIKTLQSELPREIERRRQQFNKIHPDSGFDVVRLREQQFIDRDQSLLDKVNETAAMMYWPDQPRKRRATWQTLAAIIASLVSNVIRASGGEPRIGPVSAIVDAALDRIGDLRDRDSIKKAIGKRAPDLFKK